MFLSIRNKSFKFVTCFENRTHMDYEKNGFTAKMYISTITYFDQVCLISNSVALINQILQRFWQKFYGLMIWFSIFAGYLLAKKFQFHSTK